MKLLFDQNLSHRLVKALCHDYPGSEHVRNIGLGEAADEAVWRYAAENGFILISKDADFHQRSFLFGHPPKVVWMRCGNCSTSLIQRRLTLRRPDVAKFAADPEGSFLVID